MNSVQQWIRWLNENQDLALDLVRTYLGIGLFVRGLLFMGEVGLSVEELMGSAELSFASAALMHYVTIAHLVGGVFLAIGLLTRLAALVQVPILVGAVFLVHLQDGLLTADQSLEFSALVLFLLVVVTLFGPGRWSVDHYLFVRDEPSELDKMVMRMFESASEEEPPSKEPVGAGVQGASSMTGVATSVETVTCGCGHDVHHPHVTAEPRYGSFSALRFLLGISAPVKEVVFWCETCGAVIKRTSDPEVLRQYRWHTS